MGLVYRQLPSELHNLLISSSHKQKDTNCRLQLDTTYLCTYSNVACNYNYDWNVAFCWHGFGVQVYLPSKLCMCNTNISPPPPPKGSHLHNFAAHLSNCLFFLTVDPPKITQHPERKSVTTGSSTSFTVEASGDDLHFKWRKDGKDLHDCSKYHGTNTHTLRIKEVEKSDKGCYECLVKNDGGELSDEADLVVSELVIKLFLLMSLLP